MSFARCTAGSRPRITRWLLASQTAGSQIHRPILVFIQMAAEHTGPGRLALTVLTGTTALFLCFGLAALYGRAQRAAAGVVSVRPVQA